MDKKKGAAILVAVLAAVVFYVMYTNSIVYWDAYAYEVFTTDEIIPEFTINITAADLADYPAVVSTLEDAEEYGWAMATFEDGSLYEFDDFFESQNEDMEAGFVYINYDDNSYEVNFTMYGGRDDMPLYQWLSYLSGIVAAILVLTELLPINRNQN
ncbi:MAG: hypothetical protein NWF07_16545 [Candidatus Bathyarchaeota archaeon]|nr:hypothetical protein [Candidatus Bathyarchaeota archaeon]